MSYCFVHLSGMDATSVINEIVPIDKPIEVSVLFIEQEMKQLKIDCPHLSFVQ